MSQSAIPWKPNGLKNVVEEMIHDFKDTEIKKNYLNGRTLRLEISPCTRASSEALCVGNDETGSCFSHYFPLISHRRII